MGLGTRHDFPKHRGDSYDFTFTLLNPDEKGEPDPSNPIDISAAAGDDIVWNFANLSTLSPDRHPEPIGVAILSPQKSLTNEITIVDGPKGQVSVRINSSDTAALVPGKYYYEAQYTSPSGRVSTTPYGVMTLRGDLTEPGPT